MNHFMIEMIDKQVITTFGVTIHAIFVVFVLQHSGQKFLQSILDDFFPLLVRFGFARGHFAEAGGDKIQG